MVSSALIQVFGVSYDEVHALDALGGNLVLGILRLGGHADGEEAEVAEAHTLAVEDEFLEMVEGVPSAHRGCSLWSEASRGQRCERRSP